MPPKKCAKPNGFVIFAQELMRQPGRKCNNLKEGCDQAAPIWAQMSKDKRRPYDERAKEQKERETSGPQTSEGLDVNYLQKQEDLKNQARQAEREDIRRMICSYQKGNDLDSAQFCVIHINIFCQFQNSDRYWPAEIAVASFSLRDGVLPENVYYQMVYPGNLPMGYKFVAKQHSETTHMIKVPMDDDEDNNLEDVYFSLKKFLHDRKQPGSKSLPILYTTRKNQKMVQDILNRWAVGFDEMSGVFKVYNLEEMFYFLRNGVSNDKPWPSITFSERELIKDVYAYVPETACDYHASSDMVPVFCSRSIVLRTAYVICDNCCGDLGIELVEGMHVPKSAALGYSSSNYSSSQSGRTSTTNDSRSEFDTKSDIWETSSVASQSSFATISTNGYGDFPPLHRPESRASTFDDTASECSTVRSYSRATISSRNSFRDDVSQRGKRNHADQREDDDDDDDDDNDDSYSTASRPGSSLSSINFPVLGSSGKGRARNLMHKMRAARPGLGGNN